MDETESLLAGGNVNVGVVRIGDTVRRGQTAASATVHQLLLHLEAKGFGGSPRFLGVDEVGREILSFVTGSTGIPPFIWQSDGPLIAAARLLRQYHDATVDFVAQGAAAWAFQYPDAERHEVVCHNDFAPYNFVYGPVDFADDGVTPVAIIDFDLAGPGPRAARCGVCGVLDDALVEQQQRSERVCGSGCGGGQPAAAVVLRRVWDWRRCGAIGHGGRGTGAYGR